MGRRRVTWGSAALGLAFTLAGACGGGDLGELGGAKTSSSGTSTSTSATGGGAGGTSGTGGTTSTSGTSASGGSGGSGGTTGSGGTGTTTSTSGSTSTSTSTSGAGGAGGAGGGGPVLPTPSLLSRTFGCKLLSNAFNEDPTANHVQTRFNLKGSDLGVPVASGGALYLFFGDTVGYKVIWDFGEDPDSVAHLPLADVVQDPKALCSGLEFAVTPDNPSVAHGTDASIQRDFAGAWMSPPPGQPIGSFIAQPAGPFPNMPGTFEVPTGGLDVGGKVYLVYAGRVELAPRTRATMSYLARWDAPGGLPNYQIVRPLDALVGGALGGHFIQVSPVQRSGFVHLFGTGDYRRSGVYLARVPDGALESGAGEELFDPSTSTWRAAASLSQAERQAILPVFEKEGVGELSVSYLDTAGVYAALYQREQHDPNGNVVDNRVVARFALAPEGPWTAAVTITDMADPVFRAAHCCGATCPGTQILHCDKAGLYGAYLLPAVKVANAPGGGRDLDLPFLVSTWDPYDVALFSAKVHLAP
jgi:hypothetical protein